MHTPKSKRELRRFFADCATVVVCSERMREVVESNGAAPHRVVLCGHGVSTELTAHGLASRPRLDEPWVVGYVGRILRSKGVDLLVDGFRRLRDPDVRLRIVGDGGGDPALDRELRESAARDPRIEIRGGARLLNPAPLYDGLSLLAIPSVCRETGPLVLFEAAALGVPILASAGADEQQVLARKGTVVAPDTGAAWAAALEVALAQHRSGRVDAERSEPSARVRTMRDVALEMIDHYGAVVR